MSVSSPSEVGAPSAHRAVAVPDYLGTHYWWAYLHPLAVRLFERRWLVNLILCGQYRRLADAALRSATGRTLQIACVYGDLTPRLAARCQADRDGLDVVDVVPLQLANLAAKLPTDAPVRLLRRDAGDLALPAASYDSVLLFFLLHEQPEAARRATLREAARVLRPDGRLVIVDYARPGPWHPAWLLWLPVVRMLEPFAADLWHRDMTDWLPPWWRPWIIERTAVFGGLYQVLVIRHP